MKSEWQAIAERADAWISEHRAEMIGVLSDALTASDLLTGSAAGAIAGLRELTRDNHGRSEGVFFKDDISGDLTGRDDPAYTMGGGTYSKAVPNAISFGPGTPGPSRVSDFLPEGHGGAHGRDEALPMEKVCNCARIYAAAICALDQMPDA